MKQLAICMIIGFCCAASAAAPAHCSEPAASLARFSDFPQIDVNRLLDGEIIAQRGPLMNFPNGISAQLCFAVPTSPAETARRLQTWDPTRCASLKVYASHGLRNPCELKDFSGLNLDNGHHPVKWLLNKTLATTVNKSELNLSRIEARELSGCIGKGPDRNAASPCWARLLFARASDFQRSGFTSSLPYEFGEEVVSPTSQLSSLLQEQDRITHEFAPLLQRIGLVNDGAGIPSLRPFYYWSFFEADHRATLSLGAVFELAVAGRYQLLDIEYYVSGNYYTSATLYEIWPIRDGGRTGSLVWRGDFFAAPVLRFTKGMERIAYGAIMIQEIKKEVRCFRDSLTSP
jgi:hypothetical protein